VTKSFTRVHSIEVPATAAANGLARCLASSPKSLDAKDIPDPINVLAASAVHVEVRIDGAAVNKGQINCMKGKSQHDLPWLMW
jgi:hypothetical protein